MKTRKSKAVDHLMKDFSAQKNEVIDRILENETYMMDSGLIGNLRKALIRLPLHELRILNLIIGIKLNDAEATGAKNKTHPSAYPS